MPFADVGTHRLWVDDQGAGPPIVFVHGLYMDQRMFEPQIQALKHRYRALAIDVRDHGKSETSTEDWTLWDAAHECLTAIDQTLGRPATWIGLSMGGMISLRAALLRPDAVHGLVLIDTSAETEPRAWLHKTMARLAGRFGSPMVRLFMPYVVKRLFGPDNREGPMVDEWTERILAMEPDAIERASLAVFNRESIADRLPEIGAPARVLYGEHDQATPRSHADTLHEGLPNAAFVEIPDAGHITSLENPDAVTEAIDEFLRHQLAEQARA